MLSTLGKNTAMNWLGKQLFNRDDPASFFDPLLAAVNPMWVRGFVPARLLAVTSETADTRTFQLKPSSRWHGFSAGQHVNIMVEVNGAQQHRTFSLSSTPRQWTTDGTVTLTIKRLQGGRVTNWMHDHLKPGDTIGLGQAFGEFAMPENAQPLLYIVGGSGVTPVLSHLATLAAEGYRAPVSLLYYVRTDADVIGADLLESLSASWPALSVTRFRTQQEGDSARLSKTHLEAVPGINKRHCYLCGPQGLMDRAHDLLDQFGIADDQIQATYFSAPQAVPLDADLGGDVTFGKSDLTVNATGDAPLLEIAEAASLKPQYGCRMGVCHQCSCRKTSGTVVNRLTGKASGPGEETIQLCISIPQGPVTVHI
jgi:ferredoxin-NADP reductase